MRLTSNACATLGLLVIAANSAAQKTSADHLTSRFDVAAGMTMNTPKDVNQRPSCTELGLPCLTPRTFPDFGLALQLAVYPIEHVAVVGEASVYVNRWDSVSVNPGDGVRYNHASALLVGPRLTTPLLYLTSEDNVGFRAFAQVLVGGEESTIVPTRTAVQPGAGVDVRLAYPATWLRVSGDYRSTRGGPRNLSTERVMIALVAAP